jgi:hypothetical protein
VSEQEGTGFSRQFPAKSPEPHLHLDNRALIVHAGTRTLRVGASSFPWVLETLQVLADEGRASRSSGQLFSGGFMGPDGEVTLYFGIGEEFLSVAIDRSSFDALQEGLGQARQSRGPH